jgi:hypothetical protein
MDQNANVWALARGPAVAGGRQRRDRPRGRPREPAEPKLLQRGLLRFRVPPVRAGPAELTPPPFEQVAAETSGPFHDIKRALAAAKTQLDAIPESQFDSFMRAIDMYFGLKRTLREEYGMQITTNAASKMYEMIVQMKLLACSTGAVTTIRAFCNAELPGAFLAAINHYARTMCPESNFDWVASSYYPAAAAAAGDPTILGDTYGVYAGNRDRWLMGPRPNALPEGEPDVSGDLTDPDVVAALADAVHARFGATGGATLYTSDAGVDVSADYNRQEELTALLNYGQVLCGILALAPGGHLVTKQYTFLSPFSRSLIALVSALFDETDVVKPLTSRPVNSEVYIVAKGFRGIDHGLADALLDRLASYRAAAGTTPCDWAPLLDPTLTRDVDAALLRAARQVHERQQVAFLNEAAARYARHGAAARLFGKDAHRAQEDWLSENPVRKIREDYLIATAD